MCIYIYIYILLVLYSRRSELGRRSFLFASRGRNAKPSCTSFPGYRHESFLERPPESCHLDIDQILARNASGPTVPTVIDQRRPHACESLSPQTSLRRTIVLP